MQPAFVETLDAWQLAEQARMQVYNLQCTAGIIFLIHEIFFLIANIALSMGRKE